MARHPKIYRQLNANQRAKSLRALTPAFRRWINRLDRWNRKHPQA